MDEDHPRGLPDGADDLGGVGTDDDGVAIGPRLRASHAASFGFARSALVHRSSAARGTTIRRLPSRTHGSPARVVRNWRARLYASVLLIPRTAAASSTVRNGRSLVCGSAGTDRDTKTSTGECGCVAPSSVALSATHSFGVAFDDATKNSETVQFAVLLHTSPFATKLARAQQNHQPPAPAGTWLPHPLTAAAESRRSSRSAARKNGLDADTRISSPRRSQPIVAPPDPRISPVVGREAVRRGRARLRGSLRAKSVEFRSGSGDFGDFARTGTGIRAR